MRLAFLCGEKTLLNFLRPQLLLARRVLEKFTWNKVEVTGGCYCSERENVFHIHEHLF